MMKLSKLSLALLLLMGVGQIAFVQSHAHELEDGDVEGVYHCDPNELDDLKGSDYIRLDCFHKSSVDIPPPLGKYPKDFYGFSLLDDSQVQLIDELEIEEGTSLTLSNGSSLTVGKDGFLELEETGNIHLNDTSQIIFTAGTGLSLEDSARLTADGNRTTITLGPNTTLSLSDDASISELIQWHVEGPLDISLEQNRYVDTFPVLSLPAPLINQLSNNTTNLKVLGNKSYKTEYPLDSKLLSNIHTLTLSSGMYTASVLPSSTLFTYDSVLLVYLGTDAQALQRIKAGDTYAIPKYKEPLSYNQLTVELAGDLGEVDTNTLDLGSQLSYPLLNVAVLLSNNSTHYTGFSSKNYTIIRNSKFNPLPVHIHYYGTSTRGFDHTYLLQNPATSGDPAVLELDTPLPPLDLTVFKSKPDSYTGIDDPKHFLDYKLAPWGSIYGKIVLGADQTITQFSTLYPVEVLEGKTLTWNGSSTAPLNALTTDGRPVLSGKGMIRLTAYNPYWDATAFTALDNKGLTVVFGNAGTSENVHTAVALPQKFGVADNTALLYNSSNLHNNDDITVEFLNGRIDLQNTLNFAQSKPIVHLFRVKRGIGSIVLDSSRFTRVEELLSHPADIAVGPKSLSVVLKEGAPTQVAISGKTYQYKLTQTASPSTSLLALRSTDNQAYTWSLSLIDPNAHTEPQPEPGKPDSGAHGGTSPGVQPGHGNGGEPGSSGSSGQPNHGAEGGQPGGVTPGNPDSGTHGGTSPGTQPGHGNGGEPGSPSHSGSSGNPGQPNHGAEGAQPGGSGSGSGAPGGSTPGNPDSGAHGGTSPGTQPGHGNGGEPGSSGNPGQPNHGAEGGQPGGSTPGNPDSGAHGGTSPGAQPGHGNGGHPGSSGSSGGSPNHGAEGGQPGGSGSGSGAPGTGSGALPPHQPSATAAQPATLLSLAQPAAEAQMRLDANRLNRDLWHPSRTTRYGTYAWLRLISAYQSLDPIQTPQAHYNQSASAVGISLGAEYKAPWSRGEEMALSFATEVLGGTRHVGSLDFSEQRINTAVGVRWQKNLVYSALSTKWLYLQQDQANMQRRTQSAFEVSGELGMSLHLTPTIDVTPFAQYNWTHFDSEYASSDMAQQHLQLGAYLSIPWVNRDFNVSNNVGLSTLISLLDNDKASFQAYYRLHIGGQRYGAYFGEHFGVLFQTALEYAPSDNRTGFELSLGADYAF